MTSTAPTSLHALVEEASRQLNICNACRYCEGFCAVYPALERRNLLTIGDVSQMANLCHDCRACFVACMYTPPHEFDINVPKILTEVRLADYKCYAWPDRPPRLFSGWTGVFSGAVLFSVLVLIVAMVNVGAGGLTTNDHSAASPYRFIPYPALLVLILLPALYAVGILGVAGRRFWRATGADSTATPRHTWAAIRRATWDALTLRNLRGGGADCNYPEEDVPSSQRRRLHNAVAYGFGLCLVSTIAAGVLQDIIGSEPPYPFLSVPVISGLVGGIGLVVGSVGLLMLKARSAKVMSVSQMTIKDYGLLTALTFLALSGIATFLVRSTPAFGIVFLVHIAAVMLTFAAAPYSKFSHLVYRFLALVRDHLERDRERQSASV